MPSARMSEVKSPLARLILHSTRFVLAAGILAVGCGAYAQTSSGDPGTAGKPQSESSGQPIHIVPFRENGVATSAGQQPIAGSHVSYFGGPVISNIHVVEVLYGGSGYLPGVSSVTPPSVASFSTGITASPLFDMLNEYSTAGVTPLDGHPGTPQTIGHGVFDGLFPITPSAANNGSTLTDNQIQAELVAQVAAGNLPAPVVDALGNVNTVYVLFFPPGTTIHLANITSCVPKGFCGYHSTTFAQAKGQNLLYSVLPDMQPPSGCAVGCGGSGQLDSVTNVLTHELAEAVTDPDTGLAPTIARPLAWVQTTDGQEVGDLCEGEEASVFFNAQPYTIQKIFSNFQNDCVAGPPTFNIAGGQNVSPGQQFDLPVTAQTNSSNTITTYTGTVHFTSSDPAASLPADYTFTAADAGFHTFVVSLSTPNPSGGFQTITATDTAMPLFTGFANFTVPKSAVSHFSIAEPGTAVQGTPISVVVAARDSNNNIVTSFTGKVHFIAPNDPQVVLPPDSTLPNGIGTFSITFNTVTFVSVVASDTVDGTIFGESGSNVIAPPASPTSTALNVSVDPSSFGQAVTYKASVTQTTGGPANIGMVSFSSDGLPFASISVDASGNAQTTATLNGGPHIIFADYNGGGSAHPPSSSMGLPVQVNPAPTTVAVSSTGSPSTLGAKIFLNATLSSALIPDGGFVTFKDGSSPLAVISPINGVASFGDTSLTVGSHSITANYSGSTNFAGSTSAAFVQVVTMPAPADYTLQSDKNSATLAAGQSATFVITTTSINGFNGTISFSCGNLPQLTTCTFVPPSTSVSSSGTTATSTLTVKTTGTNALLLAPQGHSSSQNGTLARVWILSPITFGVLLLAGARRRKCSYAVLGCVLTLLLVTALTSCGGGGSTPPPPPPPRTPAGATTIVVSATGTASAGNSQPANPNQNLNITITVQ